ncbi:MAG: prepilin peptidase [Rhodobacteraceae bacterium]|nr:prepilin peptidase [Paracoccaceae bacterium]MCY4327328.1 prepilin peptidase [Paracoccaceae bacterium]
MLLLWIAWEDLRRWEINPWICALTAGAWSPVVLANDQWLEHGLGAALGLGISALVRLFHPSAIGLGDIPLYTLCGWLVGFALFPAWALVNAALVLGLTSCLARKRQRSIRRCAIPAALAACPAAALIMILLWVDVLAMQL